MSEVVGVRQVTVEDVMTRDVVRVGEDAPYRAIVDLLTERHISAVPVVDAADRVVGLVSEADLLHRIEFVGEEHERRIFERPSRQEARAKSHGATARDLMTTPAVTIGPEVPVVAAAKTMSAARVKRLPVVDGAGVLLGLVARADLLRMYVRTDVEIRDAVLTTIVRDEMWLDPAGLEVDCADGVVTLRGTVDRRSTAAILVRLTEGLPGVMAVVDELGWEHDDALEEGSRFYRSHLFSTTTDQPQ